MIIPASAEIGNVGLVVTDLARSRDFYGGVLDLDVVGEGEGRALLGSAGRRLVDLEERPGARRDPLMSGLFHLAFLVPSRAALGRIMNRLAARGVPLDGAADHAVSEAIYLSDPDGHGIEIYRDRGRETWRGAEGRAPLVNTPLDRAGILDVAGGREAGLEAGTRIGHIHLEVHDLAASQAFYHDRLGLDVTADWPDRALFLAWGGYHHQIAANRFHGRERPLFQEPGVLSMTHYEILADADAVAAASFLPGAEREEGGVRLADPSGIALRIAPRPAEGVRSGRDA